MVKFEFFCRLGSIFQAETKEEAVSSRENDMSKGSRQEGKQRIRITMCGPLGQGTAFTRTGVTGGWRGK